MKSVVYEHQAAAALDTARQFWPRVDDVMITLEWTLVRDPKAGMPLVEGSAQRLVVFEGAQSVGFPTVECTFEVKAHELVFHDLEFRR